jgi:hypothetical protein
MTAREGIGVRDHSRQWCSGLRKPKENQRPVVVELSVV